MTLATLFPASFSLMFGSIKGATLCAYSDQYFKVYQYDFPHKVHQFATVLGCFVTHVLAEQVKQCSPGRGFLGI